MKVEKLKNKDLKALGIIDNAAISVCLQVISKHCKRENISKQIEMIKKVIANPNEYLADEIWKKLAVKLLVEEEDVTEKIEITNNGYFEVFGEQFISQPAMHQMFTAMKLPVSVLGALMPDAHHGYGLPIGGVLATNNSVIPYGVGVDIGCRMSLSIFDCDPKIVISHREELLKVLKENTKFGLNEIFERPNDAEILHSALFDEIPMLKRLHKKAYKQMGSSGGGNHFVEFGIVEIEENSNSLKPKIGKYFALLSHSGSRGMGAQIAQYYSDLARRKSSLPKNLQHLSWLKLDDEDGAEYWQCMNLAGDYASACHDDIHKRISKKLRLNCLQRIENHHNFAWKEKIDGQELIVHRKGATPAAQGVLGIIPGSMVNTGYIVEGLGNKNSIFSASHGAGRRLSRSEAKQNISKDFFTKTLQNAGVHLIGGTVEEAPTAYKNIDMVMQAQTNLVKVLAKFTPKIVRMDKG